jgi:hypothetical protein
MAGNNSEFNICANRSEKTNKYKTDYPNVEQVYTSQVTGSITVELRLKQHRIEIGFFTAHVFNQNKHKKETNFLVEREEKNREEK